MQVFLQPVDDDHYNDTIWKGRKLNEISSLTVEQRKELDTIFKNDTMHIWGVQSSKALNSWKKIESGNAICLFYRRGRFIGLGDIVLTFENSNLGNEL